MPGCLLPAAVFFRRIVAPVPNLLKPFLEGSHMALRFLHITAVAFTLAVVGATTQAHAPQTVPEDFVIRVERTPCYLQCPVYSVSIDAHGGVTYEGTRFVRTKGRQVDRVLVSRVAELYDAAQRIAFFDLRDQYRIVRAADGTEAVITDLPGTIVTVTAGGRTKRIEDYFGAPGSLKELERHVEEIARTNRWVSGVQQFARLR